MSSLFSRTPGAQSPSVNQVSSFRVTPEHPSPCAMKPISSNDSNLNATKSCCRYLWYYETKRMTRNLAPVATFTTFSQASSTSAQLFISSFSPSSARISSAHPLELRRRGHCLTGLPCERNDTLHQVYQLHSGNRVLYRTFHQSVTQI